MDFFSLGELFIGNGMGLWGLEINPNTFVIGELCLQNMILNTIIFNELWGHMIHVHKSAKIWNLKVDFETIDRYSIEILQNHIR